MEFYVYYSCDNNRKSGRTKITVADVDSTSIRDIKYAIQNAIQAPVCDQKLIYQGLPLTDDNMLLSRLYFREGDCFHLKFLAVADIPGISDLLKILKSAAQDIVEKLQRELPSIEDHSNSLWMFYDRLVYAVEGLAQFFFPWKNLRSVAQRHYFVQEGGFDAFLEVFKFSRQLYPVEHAEDDNDGSGSSSIIVNDTTIVNQLKLHFNQGQLVLQLCCLSFLWNFAETPEDRKFVLAKGVLPLTVDALLLHPRPQEDTAHGVDIYGMIVGVNETAIGCCGGLVESDSTTQEEVSRMTPFVEKLLIMIGGAQSESATYSLFSSQVASNTLFYCTFNVKSAPSLVACGALTRMINITRDLLVTEGGNTPLRYYGCLFLARMRSAPLIKLDRDTCVAIDELLDMFLEKHVPSEISEWEEEMSFVWMTMEPLVHLAFAAGKKSCNDTEMSADNDAYQICELESETQQSQEARFNLDDKQSETTDTQMECTPSGNLKDAESCDPSVSCEKGFTHHKCEHIQGVFTWGILSDSVSHTRDNLTETADIKDSASKIQGCETAEPEANFTWPGSKSTQKLGIFSLVHMLSITENQQLALSENLIPFLMCLSWQLDSDDKKKLSASLAHFPLVSPPSLKVVSKSVLARVNGLDLVFKS